MTKILTISYTTEETIVIIIVIDAKLQMDKSDINRYHPYPLALAFRHLTCVFRVHMRRVEAKVDEKGDGHSILEPLHHIGLAVQGVGHVASQDDVLSCTCRHKLGLLSHSVGTWSIKALTGQRLSAGSGSKPFVDVY